MSISTKIDGEWRTLYTPYANIGGEWKPGDIYVKENGIWKNVYRYSVTEADISSFRLVYKRSTSMSHPLHPHLTNNPDVPVDIKLSGETAGVSDLNEKGIIFQYTNDNPEIEGIKMYEASLYAVTNDNTFIDVAHPDTVGEVMVSKAPDIENIFGCERLRDCTIKVDATLVYESFGYYMAGWNSFFNQDQVIDTTVFPDKGPHRCSKDYLSYSLFPYVDRSPTFFNVAQIGIARDMTTSMTNMVGNHGKLSQSISAVYINGVKRPFVVEVYD